MTFRKFVCLLPAIATLALAAPVATASAQAPAGAGIPCYPYPAYCGPDGQPWARVGFLRLPFSPFGPRLVQPQPGV